MKSGAGPRGIRDRGLGSGRVQDRGEGPRRAAGERQKVAGDKGGRVERGVEEAGQRRVCPDLPWGRPLG